MSEILYYSNNCIHCKELLLKLSKTKKRDEMHFICIDKRQRHVDGSTHIILDTGQRLLLPPNVVKVPSVLLLNRGNRVIDGLKEIYNYLNPGEVEINNIATNGNVDPLAFSFSEMGSNISDNYSYLDMSAEELSAKGNGGLRTMHNFTTISANQTIETPPDDYEPNKIGSVDIGKLQEKRESDINLTQHN